MLSLTDGVDEYTYNIGAATQPFKLGVEFHGGGSIVERLPLSYAAD